MIKHKNFLEFETLNYKNNENDKFIRLVYLICKDCKTNKLFDQCRFQGTDNEDNSCESACKRISTGVLLAQYFFKKTVGHCFRLERESNDQSIPIVHKFLLNSFDNEQLWQLTEVELWKLVGHQLMNSKLASKNCKFLAFCSFSRFILNPTEPLWLPNKQVKGYVSLGGDGLALLSTHCLYTWPSTIDEIETKFKDNNLVDLQRFCNDSSNRNTRAGCFTTTLGAMVHELAHIFNLAHRNHGIMHRKYIEIDKFFIEQSEYDIQPTDWWTLEDLIILKKNSWFCDKKTEQVSTNSFTIFRQLLHSKNELALVEYRNKATNLVEYSKIFENSVRIYKFFDKYFTKDNSYQIFVLDKKGNSKLFCI